MCPRCKRLLREYLPNTTLSWSKNRILFCPRCRLFFNSELRDISHTLSLKEQEEILQAQTFEL
ncbi:MAG: hypothetical protein HYX74_11490 [Acidobacteria bacterium]|nr:hypothetical protein [Acidobacteriota bacterium]